jgi:hypothetical protein
MSRITDYRSTLNTLDDWIPYLLEESRLPGPRGNLELAYAVTQAGNQEQFDEFIRAAAGAKENTPQVFLVFCGVMGLGKLAAQGKQGMFARLRAYASDARWRVREAVATGLQLAGDADMSALVKEMKHWSKGTWYEKRAAAAALAEPRLLKEPRHVRQVLQIFDRITASMEARGDSKDEGYKVLRQGMAYCWSVAVAALPGAGKPAMEKWLASENADIRRVMKENLKKNRLVQMDAKWVKACQAKL